MRCMIAIRHSKREYQGIICYLDGHPDYVGKRIKKFSKDSLKDLIASGDIYSLDGGRDGNPIFLVKDHGFSEDRTFASVARDQWELEEVAHYRGAEYLYLYDDIQEWGKGQPWKSFALQLGNYTEGTGPIKSTPI